MAIYYNYYLRISEIVLIANSMVTQGRSPWKVRKSFLKSPASENKST